MNVVKMWYSNAVAVFLFDVEVFRIKTIKNAKMAAENRQITEKNANHEVSKQKNRRFFS